MKYRKYRSLEKDTKTCNKCLKEQDIRNFYFHTGRLIRSTICMECRAQQYRDKRAVSKQTKVLILDINTESVPKS